MTGGVRAAPGVFLVDVDDTLLDDARIQRDLRDHLEQKYGASCRERYWAILNRLHSSLGYCDYLGALQRFRIEYPQESRMLSMASFLIDYPFADRLYPQALDVLKRLRTLGPTVILSGGDAVFQPRKIGRSGIHDAVDGHVLIYIHKEDAVVDIEANYPARHYVVIDHSPRILAAFREAWGSRVTTGFVCQAESARDPAATAPYPVPDVTFERIGELLDYDLASLLTGGEIEVAR